MAEKGKDLLVSWLKDAHAMETSLVSVLEDHAEHADSQPEMQRRLARHAEETRSQAERVAQCLEQLGSDPSGGKDLMGKMLMSVQGKIPGATGDTLVKDSLMDFAVENFEIASYKALVKAAETLGEHRVADTCRDILHEEQEMAAFLDEHLSPTVEAAV